MPANTPAWLDLKISVPTLVTIGGCLIAGVSSYSRLESQVSVLQGLFVQQGQAITEIRETAERRDVAQVERRAMIDRLDRIERKLDVLK